jgi:hypothetical protein
MPIGAIIGAGSSLLGGLFGSDAASSAASAQAKAANRATDLQGLEFQAIMAQLMPFLKMGTTANQVLGSNYFGVDGQGGTFNPNAPFLQPISSVIGQPPNPNDPNLRSQFTASPGYQYQLDQMNNATQNSAAARTGAISGNMMKGLQTNAQGLASGDWWTNFNAVNQNYQQKYQDQGDIRNQIINYLTGLAGSGQNAAAQLGGFGQNAASAIGSNLIGAGNARAAGIVGSSNAMSGGLNGAASSLSSLFGGGGSGGSNPLDFLFGNSGGGGGFQPGITDFGGGGTQGFVA